MFRELYFVILNRARSIVFEHHVMGKFFGRIISFLERWALEIIGLKVDKKKKCKLLRLFICDLIGLGYYGEGAEIIDYLLDTIRHEVENTDCLQGGYSK
mgnify:CR=1 FL=1